MLVNIYVNIKGISHFMEANKRCYTKILILKLFQLKAKGKFDALLWGNLPFLNLLT